MMRRKWMIWGTLVASLLLASVVVAAPSSHSVDWWVMGGGGSRTAGSTTLAGTLGQAVAGVDGSGDYVVCTGFWYGLGPCGDPPGFSVYLPLVLRKAP